MDDDVIKSFLVQLGFKVDESSFKKFNTQLAKVEKQVMAVGKVVAATATGIVAGVAIIAHQMENLYYASQRTGETVGNLMALRYAAGQIGLTAEQAQASIESFTRTLRLNPGTRSLLGQLGVTGKNPTEMFESFIGKLKHMQPYIAAQYAALFGIDPDTLLMLENGLSKLQAEQDKYRTRLRAFGLDPEQAAQAGKDFDNSVRKLTNDFSLMWTVIESKLAPVLSPLIDQFDRWAQNHAGEVAQAIAQGVQMLANWIKSVDWHKVGNDIDKVVNALGGVKGVMIALAAITFAKPIAGIVSLAGALLRLGTATTGLATTGALGILGRLGIAGLASYAGLKVAKAAGLPDVDRDQGIKDIQNDNWGAASTHLPAADFMRAVWERFTGHSNQEIVAQLKAGSQTSSSPSSDAQQPNAPALPAPADTAAPMTPSNAPRGIRNNNPGNIRAGAFANSMGATGADKNGFAIFSDMQAGVRAAIHLLHGYISRGYGTVRKIISRWAPSSENDTESYIAAVAKKLGISADQQVSDNQLPLLAQAIFAHENGAKYAGMFNSARLGNAVVGGNRSVTIQQKTDIHVSGSHDPQQTANAVSNEQRRVNGDLVRNFAGVVA